MTETEKAIRDFCGHHADWWPSTTQVQEMLALAQPEQDNTYTYASSLAKTIWQKHYIKESPKFALLDTTDGVLTQIDNMTCGLVREKPAQPAQEPVAWRTKNFYENQEGWFYADWQQDGLTPQVAELLYTTPPQRLALSDEEIYSLADSLEIWNEDDEEWILDPNTFARAIEAAHGIKGEA